MVVEITSETNGTDDSKGNGGESKDGSNGTDDSKGDAEGDDVKSGSRGSYNPNGAGGSGSDSQITDTNQLPKVMVLFLIDKRNNWITLLRNKKISKMVIFKKKKVSKGESKKLDTLVKSGIEEKLAGKDYQSGRYYRN